MEDITFTLRYSEDLSKTARLHHQLDQLIDHAKYNTSVNAIILVLQMHIDLLELDLPTHPTSEISD